MRVARELGADYVIDVQKKTRSHASRRSPQAAAWTLRSTVPRVPGLSRSCSA